jgi:hypothetical protein
MASSCWNRREAEVAQKEEEADSRSLIYLVVKKTVDHIC